MRQLIQLLCKFMQIMGLLLHFPRKNGCLKKGCPQDQYYAGGGAGSARNSLDASVTHSPSCSPSHSPCTNLLRLPTATGWRARRLSDSGANGSYGHGSYGSYGANGSLSPHHYPSSTGSSPSASAYSSARTMRIRRGALFLQRPNTYTLLFTCDKK